MKKNTKIVLLLIFVMTAAATLFSAEPQYVLIKKPGQYIREAASGTGKIIATAKVGDAFRVVTLKGPFFEILLPTGKKAYVSIEVASVITVKELEGVRAKKSQKHASPAVEATPAQNRHDPGWYLDKYVQIAEYRTELKVAPSEKAKVMLVAKKWNVFKILSRVDDWYEIFVPPDRKAYVDSSRVALVAEEKLLSPNKGSNGISPDMIKK